MFKYVYNAYSPSKDEHQHIPADTREAAELACEQLSETTEPNDWRLVVTVSTSNE